MALKVRVDQLSHLAVVPQSGGIFSKLDCFKSAVRVCKEVNEQIEIFEKRREVTAAAPNEDQVEGSGAVDITGTLLDIQTTAQKYNPELEAIAGRLHEASTGVNTIQMALTED
jgi:6-phosphogluconate dehydrogenase (decarboxylating)